MKDRKDNSLGPAAKRYREDTRRAMLAGFAPTFVLNDWMEPIALPAGAKAAPLPDLHPAAARGLIAFLNDRTRKLSEELSVAVRPHLLSFEERAKD